MNVYPIEQICENYINELNSCLTKVKSFTQENQDHRTMFIIDVQSKLRELNQFLGRKIANFCNILHEIKIFMFIILELSIFCVQIYIKVSKRWLCYGGKYILHNRLHWF